MFNELVGLTLVSIDGEKGAECVRFKTDTGRVFQQYHRQNCCESVEVEEIIGDLNDLLNTPILVAEERTSSEPLTTDPLVTATKERLGIEEPDGADSFTWTFYELRTVKGSVTIRWYGSSNGYYSESVDFEEVKQVEAPAPKMSFSWDAWERKMKDV